MALSRFSRVFLNVDCGTTFLSPSLAALIKGNRGNCSQFASPGRIDWLIHRIEIQDSCTGIGIRLIGSVGSPSHQCILNYTPVRRLLRNKIKYCQRNRIKLRLKLRWVRRGNELRMSF